MSDLIGDLSAEESFDLKRIFFAQAHEIAEELQDVLMRIEADPGAADELTVLKRLLHTVKGDSSSLGYTALGHLCHRLEDVLVDFAAQPQERRREGIGILFEGIDEIKRRLAQVEAGADEAPAAELLGKVDLFKGGAAAGRAAVAPAPVTEYQQLQILDARERGLQVYEVVLTFEPACADPGAAAQELAGRLAPLAELILSIPEIGTAAVQRAGALTLVLGTRLEVEDLRREASLPGAIAAAVVRPWPAPPAGPTAAPARLASAPAPVRGVKSEILRVESAKVDHLLDLAGELVIARSMLAQVASDAASGGSDETTARLLAVSSLIERTVTDVHREVMKMRLVPIQALFRKFPRMIRDLANSRGKVVRLEVHGEQTELDKGIADALGEPLSHLIRNLVDHGIEFPDQRRAAGKAEAGTVTLRACQEGSHIVIEAADDGRGIDVDRLRREAVAKGMIGAAEAARLSEQDAQRLVFLSGLSTAAVVSETSGRGVGMDAVKSAVESMKGTVEIESVAGRGATFRLRLPITLAVIKALLFEVGARPFAVPVASIAAVERVTAQEVLSVDGRPVVLWRNQLVSVIDVRELFHLRPADRGSRFVVILSLGGRRVGLLIDRLLRQQELVIKSLDERYLNSNLVAGASIHGDGTVVLILDSYALLAKAVAIEKEKLAAR
jgi:two-component system chemotaxis sensor kinase CheA